MSIYSFKTHKIHYVKTQDVYIAAIIKITNNQIIIHKTLFAQTEFPYRNASERRFDDRDRESDNYLMYTNMPLGGGASPISEFNNPEELFRQLTLSALNDTAKVRIKVINSKFSDEKKVLRLIKFIILKVSSWKFHKLNDD